MDAEETNENTEWGSGDSAPANYHRPFNWLGEMRDDTKHNNLANIHRDAEQQENVSFHGR